MSAQGYDPSTGYMDFSLALREMKKGKSIKRAGWRSIYWRISEDGKTVEDDAGCEVRFVYWGEVFATDWEEVL